MIVAPVCITNAQGDQLPTEAQKLLQKLKEFETGKRAEVEKEIQARRDEVAKALEQHVATETKLGNLEKAIAVKAEIARLKNSANPVAPEQTTDPLEAGIAQLAGTWKWYPGQDLTIDERGRATHTHGWTGRVKIENNEVFLRGRDHNFRLALDGPSKITVYRIRSKGGEDAPFVIRRPQE